MKMIVLLQLKVLQIYVYTDQKITQILSSRYTCQVMSQLEIAP